MPNSSFCGLKRKHDGKRPHLGLKGQKQEPLQFEDENTGPDGCPSLDQIQERCAAIREHEWDALRWAKEKRRSGETPPPRLLVPDKGKVVSDRELMRWMLWTDGRSGPLVYGKDRQ